MIGYTLGIDGGGTKTEAVVLDSDGSVVGSGTAGASNTNFMPRQTAANAYKKAIRTALTEAGITPEDVTCAGCTFGSVAREVFAELGIPVAPHGYAESHVALERAGITEKRGVAVIAGTGSSCGGYGDDGKRFGSGGWGPLFGDEGSAYDIGLRGIKRALWASEGRVPATMLIDAVKEYFGVDNARGAVFELCAAKINQARIAGFAVEVSKAARAGDEAAAGIIEEAGEMLGELAAFVARHVFAEEDSFPIVLAGGVFNIGKPILDPIRAVLTPQFSRAKIIVAKMRPGEAVARIAYRDCLRGE